MRSRGLGLKPAVEISGYASLGKTYVLARPLLLAGFYEPVALAGPMGLLAEHLIRVADVGTHNSRLPF